MEDVIQCHSMRVAGTGPPCILQTAYKCYFRVRNASGGSGPALLRCLLEGGPWHTLHPQHCTQVLFQSEGNASGWPGPALQPVGERALAQYSLPWPTLQHAAGRALAYPASATLHTSAISE
jgi:hypothetical protein